MKSIKCVNIYPSVSYYGKLAMIMQMVRALQCRQYHEKFLYFTSTEKLAPISFFFPENLIMSQIV